MYYVVYIGYEPDASLYERNVISFHQACETFESIEEARKYIKEYIIDDLKLDVSAGEVDINEIEVDYSENNDRVRLEAYYGDTCIYVYECWIMESL